MLFTVVISLLVTGGLLGYISFQAQLKQQNIIQSARSQVIAEKINSYIFDLQRNLSYLARIRGLTTFDADIQHDLLTGLVNSNRAYGVVGLTDESGHLLTQMSLSNETAPMEWGSTVVFRRTFREQEDYIGVVELDPGQRWPTLIMATPIRDSQNKVDGMLFARINLKFLWAILAETETADGGYVYIIDQRNLIIARSTEIPGQIAFEDLSDSDLVKVFSSETNDQLHVYRGLYNEKVLGSIARTSSANWRVVNELPLAKAYAPALNYLTVILLGLLFSILFAMALGTSVSRRITQPLEQLTETARHLSNGEFESRVSIAREDELKTLGDAFNHMAAELQNTISDLQNQITQRKQAEDGLRKNEQKFRELFNLMDEAVQLCELVFDGQDRPVDMILLDVNPAYEKHTGRLRENVIGRRISEIDPDIEPVWLQRYGDLVRLGTPIDFEEFNASTNRWFHVSASRTQGNFFFAIFSDITQRKQSEQTMRNYADDLERSVKQRTAELIQANRAKDEFLANMSHELRTPLNGILGFSETLLEGIRGQLDDRQKQAVEIINSSGLHLLGLINDILDLSKIESGKFELRGDNIFVNDVCRSSLSFVNQIAIKKHVNIDYERSPDATMIFADSKRLKQILVNLLNNAVKFTPENGMVKLEVSLNAAGDFMEFSVTDTGIGISPENQQKLFKPFVQVDSGLSRQYEGTGLGLSLVKKLVEMHGGSVGVESEVGVGSRFYFTIPVIQHDTLMPDEEVIEPPVGLSPLVHGELSILLAEDNPVNSMVTGDYLITKGYTVIYATNGLDAIEKIKTFNPSLIIMDIQMPGLDGIEAIKRIRALPNAVSTPIIALTARAMPGDRERCLEAGANEYMTKPARLRELAKMVDNMLFVS